VWKHLFEFIRQAFTLTEAVSRHDKAIEALEHELGDLAQATYEEIQRLHGAIERLATEIQRSQEREESERRILKLELENRLLRSERGLPPESSAQDE